MPSRTRPQSPNKQKVQVTFGAAVRTHRETKLLTQERLAELADLHTNYVSSVERGERNIGLYNIVRLAHALGISVSTLTGDLDSR